MNKVKWLLLWCAIVSPLFANESAKFSLEGYDPKSCTFLSQDRLQALSIVPVSKRTDHGDYYETGELESVPFFPASYRTGSPSGLDLYQNSPFLKKKIKAITTLSIDRHNAPMCVLYEGGEAYCHDFQAHDAVYFYEINRHFTSCDIFFVRDRAKVPTTHEWVGANHCVIHVPLEKTESIEKMLLSDQMENWGSWNHDESRNKAESLKNVCFLNNAGAVKCIGANNWGVVGNGDPKGLYPTRGEKMPSAMTVEAHRVDLGSLGGALIKVTDACLYNNYACAVLENGRVKCWGSQELPVQWVNPTNDQKFYKIGTLPNQMGDALPALELGDVKAKKVDCSFTHMCALMEDGTTKCAGSNNYGQLGYSEDIKHGRLDLQKSFPVAEIPGESESVSLFTQAGSTCAILSSGHLSCFGWNMGGILGAPAGEPAPHNVSLRLDEGKHFPIVPIDKAGGIVGACMDPVLYPWAYNVAGRKACVLYGDGTMKCWKGGWEKTKRSLAENLKTVRRGALAP